MIASPQNTIEHSRIPLWDLVDPKGWITGCSCGWRSEIHNYGTLGAAIESLNEHLTIPTTTKCQLAKDNNDTNS